MLTASMMKVVTVLITNCDLKTAWYSDLIGEKFICYKNFKYDYILKEDYDKGSKSCWRYIDKNNCKEIIGEINATSIS